MGVCVMVSRIGRLLLAGLVLGTPVLVAWSSSWVKVAEGHQIDAQSLRWSGRVVTFWDKTLSKTPKVAWSLNRVRVDCDGETLQLLASTDYDAAGSVVSNVEMPLTPSAINPDSVGEAIEKIVCATPH